MSDTSKVLATKFTDDRFPIEWKDEAEKSLMWFYDDLHCPNHISPLYFDIGGWWDCDGRWGSDCTYMYQRFGAPIGKAWIAKNIGGYVYSAVVPPEMDADKIGPMFDYYVKVMPIYADTFLDRWHKMYIPRLKEIQNAMLDCDFEHKSLPEIMIHMEDMLDMKSEAFRIHWIINLAQFQASTDFTNAAKAAGADDVLIGKINVSPADRNWDSLKALWEMKEEVCRVPALKELFLSTTNNAEIMAKVADVPGSEKFLEMMEAYRNEYGFKAMYTHEFIYKTWYEDPTPAYEAVRTYVNNNYDYNAEYDACMQSQKEDIEQLYSMVSDPEELAKLKHYLELCVKMAPITPDHHFYIDQGVYSHMRVAFVQIDGDQAALSYIIISGKRRALNNTVFGTHDEIFVVFNLADLDHRRDLFIRQQGQKVRDIHAEARAGTFRNLKALDTVDTSHIREEHDIIMVIDDEHFGRNIFVTPRHT